MYAPCIWIIPLLLFFSPPSSPFSIPTSFSHSAVKKKISHFGTKEVFQQLSCWNRKRTTSSISMFRRKKASEGGIRVKATPGKQKQRAKCFVWMCCFYYCFRAIWRCNNKQGGLRFITKCWWLQILEKGSKNLFSLVTSLWGLPIATATLLSPRMCEDNSIRRILTGFCAPQRGVFSTTFQSRFLVILLQIAPCQVRACVVCGGATTSCCPPSHQSEAADDRRLERLPTHSETTLFCIVRGSVGNTQQPCWGPKL